MDVKPTPRFDAIFNRPHGSDEISNLAQTLERECAGLRGAVEKCLLAGGYDAKGDTESANELFAQARTILAQHGR